MLPMLGRSAQLNGAAELIRRPMDAALDFLSRYGRRGGVRELALERRWRAGGVAAGAPRQRPGHQPGGQRCDAGSGAASCGLGSVDTAAIRLRPSTGLEGLPGRDRPGAARLRLRPDPPAQERRRALSGPRLATAGGTRGPGGGDPSRPQQPLLSPGPGADAWHLLAAAGARRHRSAPGLGLWSLPGEARRCQDRRRCGHDGGCRITRIVFQPWQCWPPPAAARPALRASAPCARRSRTGSTRWLRAFAPPAWRPKSWRMASP